MLHVTLLSKETERKSGGAAGGAGGGRKRTHRIVAL